MNVFKKVPFERFVKAFVESIFESVMDKFSDEEYDMVVSTDVERVITAQYVLKHNGKVDASGWINKDDVIKNCDVECPTNKAELAKLLIKYGIEPTVIDDTAAYEKMLNDFDKLQ